MELIRSLALLLALACAVPAIAEELQVGDSAPAFSLMGSDGKQYSLADFKGKQAVVLAWYPRAFTSGCTVECKSLAENGHLIREYDVTYFMASVDEVEENRRFAEETEADFPLLSDPEKQVAEAYGVLAMMGFAKRHTFYIGVDGTILKIDRAINPATAAQDMAANLGALGIPKR
ncbi:peroxiredoxin [Haliea sp.]|uniref:peroxiredoxin n=1 Tax=Haliea sp. TaxID=1932666 RepID=UPI0035295790